jgi:hypothetical protein
MISGAYFGGLAHLLTLISFIILLCSVYGITNFFEWRLLNAVMLFITTALILCLNSLYFAPQFDAIKARKSGTATKKQIELLDKGHYRKGRKK